MPAAEPSVCLTVPFHANAGYLEAALRSLRVQSDHEWTAIVVDDASSEAGAADLVARLDDPRVTFVRNAARLGVAANFNRCLSLGSEVADVVAIVHADDELAPGFVAAVRAAHRAAPGAVAVATRVTVIDERGMPRRTVVDTVKELMWPRRLPCTLAGDRGVSRLVHGQFLYCPAVSYRVSLLPATRFDTRWRQVMDLDLFARLLLGGGAIRLVPDRAYRYRRHAGSMSGVNTRSGVRRREERAVIEEVVFAARRLGWRRTVVAGRLRLTHRASAMLSRLPSPVRGHDWSRSAR